VYKYYVLSFLINSYIQLQIVCRDGKQGAIVDRIINVMMNIQPCILHWWIYIQDY